jgi:hypothetical protein
MDKRTEVPPLNDTQARIIAECEGIKSLLLSKNSKYGNSAANPAQIFAQTNALDQIAIRCDDKLSRIRNMGGLIRVLHDAKHVEEDTVLDLIGYLLLARVVHKQQVHDFDKAYVSHDKDRQNTLRELRELTRLSTENGVGYSEIKSTSK